MNAYINSKSVHFDDGDIEVHELTARQLMAMSQMDAVDQNTVLGMATGLSPEQIDRLTSGAVMALMEAFNELNASILETKSPDTDSDSTSKK